jgi:hypothetical protein
LRAALSCDLQKMHAAKIVEANMQMHAQTQATFTMPAKPHRFVASDRVEGTPVRRSDGTKIGTIERLMIDKVSGKVAYAVLGFGGFMGVGVKHMPVSWDRMKYAIALDAYEINLRTNRPNTWPHRPMLQREESSCQPGAVHTWPKADMSRCTAQVCFRGQSRHDHRHM